MSKERSPGSNPMDRPGFLFHLDLKSRKTGFMFFWDFWRTRLARSLLGVAKERSWAPSSNSMRRSGFPVHLDLENWINRKTGKFTKDPFIREPDKLSCVKNVSGKKIFM